MEEDDNECPHGLDPAWCTFCIKKAAGELPGGVRRPRAPTAPPTRPRAGTGAPARAGRSRASATPRRPALAVIHRGPAEALVALRTVLFHVTAYQAWPSIQEVGLLPAAQILENDARLTSTRNEAVEATLPTGQRVLVRDQRAMARSNMEAHLDGIGLVEWLEMINERVFLFARQRELTTYLARNRELGGQDVVVFDTARLLAAAKGRVEVATVNPTGPVPWERCRCRGRATFEAVEAFAGDVADIEEVTVFGGIEPVSPLVTRVMRYHPDGKTEVVVG